MVLGCKMLIITALLCLGVYRIFGNPIPRVEGEISYRLPEDVEPISYDIQIDVSETFPNDNNDITDFRFDGTVDIRARSKKDKLNVIRIHANDMDISEIRVKRENDIDKILLPNIDNMEKYHFVDIILTDEIELKINDEFNIIIKYKGHLRDDMHGFYMSSYTDKNNEKQFVATTQFQPTHARRAFPCFDEPQYKARFQITIIRPKDYHSLSNMAIQQKHNGEKYDTDIYKKTPLMSSYLVAFIVSKFDSVEGTDPNFKVWARPEAKMQTNYIAGIGMKIVKDLDKFTNIPYFKKMINKLDMAALPDFSAGAMENWGLLTYRETALLVDDKQSTNRNKQSVATTVTHELAHQWFGDYVTTKWWDSTWLNEGFATYFQYYTTKNVETEWELEDQFVVDQLQSVFGVDALLTSKPMTTEVNSPSEISAHFGSISYNKGGSVIRMMEHFLGHENFKEGLQTYLRNNEFKNTVPQNLWDALETTKPADIPFDIATVMKGWTETSGYPVISVSVDGNKVKFTQSRFLLSGNTTSDLWHVPISYTISNKIDFENTKPKLWLTPNKPSVEELLTDGWEWLIVNIQETGYYRVNYDIELWARLSDALKSEAMNKIHKINRAQLVDDVMNLARAGLVRYETALNVLDYLSEEVNYYPWYSAFQAFRFLMQRYAEDDDTGIEIRKYILRLMQKLVNDKEFVDPVNERHVDVFNRVNALEWACQLGHERCIQQAKEQFKALRDSPDTSISVNVKSIVYCTALRHGDKEDWNFLWKKFVNSNVAAEKVGILNALGCSKDKDILNDYLQKSINGDIRKQDAAYAFSSVYTGNSGGVDIAFEFLKKHHKDIRNSYAGLNALSNAVTGLAARLNKQKQIESFEEFLKQNAGDLKDVEVLANAALEIAKNNVDWAKKYSVNIGNYIRNKMAVVSYRLPDNIEPLSYTVTIDTTQTFPNAPTRDADTHYTFSGKVKIKAKSKINMLKNIRLHANDMEITSVEIQKDGNAIDVREGLEFTEKYHFVDYNITKDVNALNENEEFDITIKYNGNLRDDMHGFYMSTYTDKNNNINYVATTQFQPTHARRAFPCFDEPQYKAKFQITIIRPKDYNSISNMPISKTTNDANSDTDVYEETPKMSTYLIAFIVSKFESNNGTDQRFKVWARPEAMNQTKYTAEIGMDIVNDLVSFTGITYFEKMINKLDMAALPDFSAGAMENWGLLTYRETALLVDEEESTNNNKQRVATVVAHEMAHQWFGDYVTTKWWDSTWLNEGFARYFQYHTTANVETDWELTDQFVVEQQQAVFGVDALESSNPMTTEVNSPAEISAHFGSISYNKGASVIRMMEHFIGHENFKEGLRVYLRNHAFSTTVPKDLWTALESKKPTELQESIAAIMTGWTEKSGYPVITVSITKDKTVSFTQTRFLLSGNTTDDLWYVPISYTTSKEADFNNTKPKLWLTPETPSAVIESTVDWDWLIVNIQETGYYRVNYENNLWIKLSDFLKKPEYMDTIHKLNRAQLVDDVMNLARAGVVEYGTALNVLDYLSEEVNYYPWYSAFQAFRFLMQRYAESDNTGKEIREYILALMEKLVHDKEFKAPENETQIEVFNRVNALEWACNLGHTRCINEAKQMFSEWKTKNTKISANVRSIVYCTALRHGTKDDWDYLWDEFSLSNVAAQKVTILNALGCSKDKTILNEYLKKSLNSEEIRKQDASSAFTAVYTGNSIGVDVAFEFLKQNYTEMKDSYGGMNALNKAIAGLAARLTKTIQVENLKTFLEEKKEELEEVEAEVAIESAIRNIEWAEKYSNQIGKYIKDKNKPKPEPTPEPGQDATTVDPNNEASSFITNSYFNLPLTLTLFVIYNTLIA